MKKHLLWIIILTLIFVSTGYTQLIVKDNDDNVLMQVNDEGTTGSISLPSGTAPLFKTGKLYNQGSYLYWSGTKLGTAGSAGGWTDSGSKVYTTSSSDRVGIGTASPEFKLTLDNDGGILAKGTYGSGSTLATSGAGARLLWYPRKVAFRAGSVNSSQWDHDNIGNYSMALGRNTKASGGYSTAMGLGATASNSFSTAIGYNTEASGAASTAMGNSTTASATSATAMGVNTTASGGASTAIGDRTTAEAYASLALGRYNIGGGTAGSWVNTDPLLEIGIGIGSSARANAVTVLKNGNVGMGISSPAFSLDVKDSLGINGTRVLYLPDQDPMQYKGTMIIGDGGNNLSKNYPYHSEEGSRNTAVGFGSLYATTDGFDNTAVGYDALYKNTRGSWNVAIGRQALSDQTCGYFNTAIGVSTLQDHCCGYDNTAIGAHALSSATYGDHNTAIGSGAGFDSGYDELSNTTAIGYGARVNANNKVVIGNTDVTHIGGYADWVNYSDRRFKENIEYRNELGLDFIMTLNTVSFNYKEDANKRRRDGLITQDVQRALDELGIEFSGLIIDDNAKKTMNLSYGLLVIPLINAVKEQQTMINELKHANEAHLTKNNSLRKELAQLKSLIMDVCGKTDNAHIEMTSLTSR